MAESQNSEALVIKRDDWRESDSRVVLYTKNFGKIVLIARGIKKFKSKLAGHIEPLTLIQVMILKGKHLDYLGSAISKEAYLNIKSDLNALYFVGAALSLFNNQVKEGVPDEELYDFLSYWLLLVNDRFIPLDKTGGELLYNYFVVRLLVILGYKPQLRHCLNCEKLITPADNYFNFRLGGLICPSCFAVDELKYLPTEIVKISDDCIKILRIFSENSQYQVLKLSPSVARELSRLTRSWLDFS